MGEHAGGEAGHLTLKSDRERAIAAVREALAKSHGGKVVQESPPRGERQSNGTVEEVGKTARECVCEYSRGKSNATRASSWSSPRS